MHEFVAEGRFTGTDIHALDITKRLMDYDFHPPTNYFPLIVPEALMIEPTETENKDTLDAFADALIKIAEEARTIPNCCMKRRTKRNLAAWTRSRRPGSWCCVAGCRRTTVSSEQ